MRMVRARLKPCKTPRSGCTVLIVGLPRLIAKLHRPWPGGSVITARALSLSVSPDRLPLRPDKAKRSFPTVNRHPGQSINPSMGGKSPALLTNECGRQHRQATRRRKTPATDPTPHARCCGHHTLSARGDRLRGPLQLHPMVAATIQSSSRLSHRDNQNRKPLASAAERRNHPRAAAAGNLILIDARISPRLSRHSGDTATERYRFLDRGNVLSGDT